MLKFKIGQEVYFISYVGNDIRSATNNADVILCDVIANAFVYNGITYYTFENLCFRLPENKLFATYKEAKEWLEKEVANGK